MEMKVGIQLYSVRNSMQKDPVATIKKVLGCGYKYLEAANHIASEDPGLGFGIDARELKKILDDAGSKIVSAHIYPFDEEKYQSVMDYNLIIGNKNLVYPMDQYKNLDDVMRSCERFNKLGEMSRKNGLNFLYHNHCHEFMTINGKPVMDIILENTEPENFGLELDTFWAMRGGLSPVETIKKYSKRITLLHQKDMSKNTDSPVDVFSKMSREVAEGHAADITRNMQFVKNEDFTEIGTGIMDIQGIINAANETGSIEYIILEQDQTRMPDEIESIKCSMEHFKKYNGINWA